MAARAVQRAEQQAARVGRVGGGCDVAVGGGVGRDGLGLGDRGSRVGVGGDGAHGRAGGAPAELQRAPGGVGDQSADQGDSRAEDGGCHGRGEAVSVEPVVEVADRETETEGGDGQYPEHGVHGEGFAAVVGGFGSASVEGEQPQAHRVGGGQQGRHQAGDEDDPARADRGDVRSLRARCARRPRGRLPWRRSRRREGSRQVPAGRRSSSSRRRGCAWGGLSCGTWRPGSWCRRHG